ncbi:AbrB/MazE/SpoVT family DNA-binding domain-containing protein [Candidatus Saccharibacteria bacterium]|nr:AbrB/MazE/SpoVT family DNA-binding domain-containing protein [Candidatus Saccharibacteria bacterium]
MIYTVALTSTGQMTLPKDLRLFLGVDGARRVSIVRDENGVFIRRKKSEAEFREQMEKFISPETKRIIEGEEQGDGRPPVREMMLENADTEGAEVKWEAEYEE